MLAELHSFDWILIGHQCFCGRSLCTKACTLSDKRLELDSRWEWTVVVLSRLVTSPVNVLVSLLVTEGTESSSPQLWGSMARLVSLRNNEYSLLNWCRINCNPLLWGYCEVRVLSHNNDCWLTIDSFIRKFHPLVCLLSPWKQPYASPLLCCTV